MRQHDELAKRWKCELPYRGDQVRAIIETSVQRCFFTQVRDALDCSWSDLARQLGIPPSTFHNWCRATRSVPLHTMQELSNRSGVPLPPFQVEKDTWGQALGGRSRQIQSGAGLSESARARGNAASQRSRLEQVRTEFDRLRNCLAELPVELAEFAGVMLGDGGLYADQLQINLNLTDDAAYADYLVKLVQSLFGVAVHIQERPARNLLVLRLYGLGLTGYLETIGLPVGNKLLQQVDVPDWIWTSKGYMAACARGLFDTDGSVYARTKQYRDRVYQYPTLTFSNRSLELLGSVSAFLAELGYTPNRSGWHITLSRTQEVARYFREVGTHNPKHLTRYHYICKIAE